MLFCFRSDALRQHPFGPKVCGVLGSRATEVWILDQTSGAQAPCFGGLLGLADWTASRSERFEANRRRRLLGRDRAFAATTLRAASRARGHRAHVVLGSRPKQRPSLLGLSARSALTRDARAGCASRGGVSDPSPCAPPRQAGWLGPIGHCVVGFCGSIRLVPAQTDRRRAPSSKVRGVLGSRPKRPHSRLSRAGAKRG